MDRYYCLNLNPGDISGMGLRTREFYTAALGAGRAKVCIRQNEKLKPGTGCTNDSLAQKLGLPGGLVMNIIKQDDVLRIGPLVGILAAQRPFGKRRFSEQEGYFRHLLSSLRRMHGFGYVFVHQDIDWDNQSIRAFCRREHERDWQIRKLPFPDVVYNRYLSNRDSLDTRSITGRLGIYGVRSFNTSLGSKLEVYEHLKQHPETAQYLPETVILDALPTLAFMLERHGEVYVKTLNGHLGKNIVRISETRRGYLVKKTGDKMGKYYSTIARAYQDLGWAKGAGRLIVQQSIISPGRDTHFDVRVLMQKDRHNQWQFTGAAARLGRKGMITTNLHTGGSACKLARVLASNGFSYSQVRETTRELEHAARAAAAALEGRTENLGDIGLDYVIDRKGKPWFLEANPRAGRRSFANLGSSIRRLAVQRPMEYASCLAGF